VVYIDSRAITDAEAMDWVVLNVNIMDRARSEDFAKLNEVVRSVGVSRNIRTNKF
jgi:hypothetical protein